MQMTMTKDEVNDYVYRSVKNFIDLHDRDVGGGPMSSAWSDLRNCLRWMEVKRKAKKKAKKK